MTLDHGHYLEFLKQRQLAFHRARPVRNWKKHWHSRCTSFWSAFAGHGKTRSIHFFIESLLLFRDHKSEHVETAIAVAVKVGISASDGIRHLLHHYYPQQKIVDLERYAQLLEVDILICAWLGGG